MTCLVKVLRSTRSGVPVFSGRGRWHKSCCNHQSDYLGQTGRRQGLEKCKHRLQLTAWFPTDISLFLNKAWLLTFPCWQRATSTTWWRPSRKSLTSTEGRSLTSTSAKRYKYCTCLRPCAIMLWISGPFDLNHRWKWVYSSILNISI